MNDELPPLRERVPWPGGLRLPDGPQGIQWRALSIDDAQTVTELAERISARDHPTWSESLDEIREELDHSWVDPNHDGVLALDDTGTAVAWGLVVSPPDPESIVRVFLQGGVDPAHRGRGVGRALLAWQHDRARQMLADSTARLPAWVLSYAADAAPEHGALLTRAGFGPSRYFTSLECDLAVVAGAPPLPHGVTAESFSPGLSESVREAKNLSFADHWGSQPMQREQWESVQSLPSFRPELCRIARAGDQVVGFVITEINEDDWQRQGARSAYISLVGTVREWRGRGLAGALLGQVLEAFRDAGLELAVLDVDTENPTGALGVYTRLGFVPTTRDVAFRVVY
ncbi:MAG: GNAT family N-acetyltransferase [Microcella sp.]|nr:GNAT family N-acetyltransferase [Microcella sp.]